MLGSSAFAPPVRLLGLSGSLRRASTNTMLLRAVAANAPKGVEFRLFDHLGDLPIFNPDRDESPWPSAVAEWRAEVRAADGLVIACPEYAHGIPGGLKNALDWLVSGSEAPGKPVVLFHATARSTHGRDALAEVLRTMSMDIRPEFSLIVPLMGLNEAACAALLASSESRELFRAAIDAYAVSLRDGADASGAALGTTSGGSHILDAGEPPESGPRARFEGKHP